MAKSLQIWLSCSTKCTIAITAFHLYVIFLLTCYLDPVNGANDNSISSSSLSSSSSSLSSSSSSSSSIIDQSKKPHHLNSHHTSGSIGSNTNLYKPTSLLLQAFASSASNSPGVPPNPYPVRTMIGNLMFKLRQHRTQMLVIPSLLRIVYQYRRPIADGLASAYQSLMASAPGGSGAASSAAASGARVSEAIGGDSVSSGLIDPLMTSGSSHNYDTMVAPPPSAGSSAHPHQHPYAALFHMMAVPPAYHPHSGQQQGTHHQDALSAAASIPIAHPFYAAPAPFTPFAFI